MYNVHVLLFIMRVCCMI